MGADLITNSVMIPVKQFRSILRGGIKELTWKVAKSTTLSDLAKLVSISDYEMEIGEEFSNLPDGFEKAKELVLKDLEDIKEIRKMDDVVGRDTGWHSFIVNGMEVYCMYAGEMSWGDSPDGHGYRTIGALLRLGFAERFSQVIPWSKKKK